MFSAPESYYLYRVGCGNTIQYGRSIPTSNLMISDSTFANIVHLERMI